MGGINGGVILMKPSHRDFENMLKYLKEYKPWRQGAEQDFLTDSWRLLGGIHTLPRKCNVQLHQVALIGRTVPDKTLFMDMIVHSEADVANWHFSADPQPVDFLVVLQGHEEASQEKAIPPWRRTGASSSSSSSSQPWRPGLGASSSSTSGQGSGSSSSRPPSIVQQGAGIREARSGMAVLTYVRAILDEMQSRASRFSTSESPLDRSTCRNTATISLTTSSTPPRRCAWSRHCKQSGRTLCSW